MTSGVRFAITCMAVNLLLGTEAGAAAEGKMGFGTGWPVTPRHVVTNFHVVEGFRHFSLMTVDKRLVQARLVARDPVNDLAILEVADTGRLPPPLPLAPRGARVGSRVFTVGYPHPNLMGVTPKLTTGIVNALTGLHDDPRSYQISVPLQSGNSGAPLLNMNGEVVGVVTSKLHAAKVYAATGDMAQNVNYAVKIAYLRPLLDTVAQADVPGTSAQGRVGLEELAAKIIPSVLLVVASDRPLEPSSGRRDAGASGIKHGQPPSPGLERPKGSIAVLAYAEPGNYDEEEDISGSSTLPAFSNSLAMTIVAELRADLGREVAVRVHAGEQAKRWYEALLEEEERTGTCEILGTSMVIAGITEANPGSHFREVAYAIVDCISGRYYKRSYTIERHEDLDGYGYETELGSMLRRFLVEMPPSVMARRHR